MYKTIYLIVLTCRSVYHVNNIIRLTHPVEYNKTRLGYLNNVYSIFGI